MARIVIGRSEFWLRKIQEKKGGKARNALPPKQQIKPKETGQNQRESLAIDLELNFTGVTGKLLKLFRAERNKMYQAQECGEYPNLVRIQHLGLRGDGQCCASDFDRTDTFSNVLETFSYDFRILLRV